MGHLLVGDNVDDAAFGFVTRRRVADDLYALDVAGGHHFQVLLQAFGIHVRRLVVNPHFYIAAASERDFAFCIHLHARCILQGVRSRTRLNTWVVIHIVKRLFAVGGIDGARGCYLNLIQ